MALFYLCLHFQKHFSWTFSVGYIDHGKGSERQEAFRQKARGFTKDLCEKFDVPWYSNGAVPSSVLQSESDFREYRYTELEKIRLEVGADHILLGHHKEDQLETRLLQMIRGAGEKGLQGMVENDGVLLRPILSSERQELEAYVDAVSQVRPCEDPSNQDPQYLRNWLRQIWLPQLEVRRPGSLKTLSRSLENMATPLADELANLAIQDESISMEVFLTLSRFDQSRVLAIFFRERGLKNYGKSHVDEVIKRLDTGQKKLTFNLLKRQWKLDAGRLKVLGLGEIEPDDG